MPRPERRLDPDADDVQRFAHGLRELRQKADAPAYRQLARVAHYSPATLAEAAGGRKLPSLAVTLAYVRACGGDPAQWEQRWREIACVPDNNAGGDASPAQIPYVGLAAFQTADAHQFFGREALIAQLQKLVEQRRLVGVVGPSGTGKSSLLRAGLAGRSALPAVVVTPRADPIEECAVHLAAVTGGSAASWREDLVATPANLHLRIRQAMAHDDGDLLLVIDQFEEVVTLCSEQNRAWLAEAVLHAAGADNSRVRIVLGIRADFYSHGALHPELVSALWDASVLVGGMTAQELREAITTPATQAGYQVETALVARVVADAAGQAAALPLVSHAMLETWRRRRGVTLTLAGYEAAGGIQQAVARTAEEVYRVLGSEEQQAVRRLFLRLIAIGEGTEDTKRRIGIDELDDDPDNAVVLEHLTEARLLVVDHAGIEMIHEALIQHWPRLREWLAADRDGQRIHRHLTDATAGWRALNRDPGSLYRGARLARAQEWAGTAPDMLTSREREFLEASTAADSDEQRRVRRRNRQLRWLAAALAVLLLVVAGIAVVAIEQRQEAVTQQQIALSRQLAAQAREFASQDADKAIRWALEAYHASPTVEARSILLSLASRPNHTARLREPRSVSRRVAISPDRRLLASMGPLSGSYVNLWDLTTRTRLTTLQDDAGESFPRLYTAFAFSADGARLAAAGPFNVVVWDVSRRVVLARYDAPEGVASADVAISPDLRLVAYVGRDHSTVTVRDTATREVIIHDAGAGGPNATIAFSPDGRFLAATSEEGATTLWDTTTRTRTASLAGGRGPLTAVAFSPDAAILATGGADGNIVLWDVRSRSRLADLTGHVAAVRGLAFHPRSTILISTGLDTNKVTFWDINRRIKLTQLETNEQAGLGAVTISADGDALAITGREPTLYWNKPDLPLIGHSNIARTLAFTSDGKNLLSVDEEGFYTWDISTREPATHTAFENPAIPGFSSNGQILAVKEQIIDDNGPITFWDLAGRRRIGQITTDPTAAFALSPVAPVLATGGTGSIIFWDVLHSRQIGEIGFHTGDRASPFDILEFSRDGKTLATYRRGAPVQLWDIEHRTRIAEFPHHGELNSIAFSPNGHLLATAAADGAVKLVDLASHAVVANLTGHTGASTALAFTHNGQLLAGVGGADRAVILWDVTTRTHWATLSGHTDDILSVAASPDNSRLATGSRDRTITLWTIDPSEAVNHLCHKMTLNTTSSLPGCPHS